MNKLSGFAALSAFGLTLAACGSTDDASTEATPDTVEMPADEALAPIAEGPVEDDAAAETAEAVDPADTAPDLETTEEAADAAADVAAEAAAAAEAASNDLIDQAVDAAEDAAGDALPDL